MFHGVNLGDQYKVIISGTTDVMLIQSPLEAKLSHYSKSGARTLAKLVGSYNILRIIIVDVFE